jgi:hypothetical protein
MGGSATAPVDDTPSGGKSSGSKPGHAGQPGVGGEEAVIEPPSAGSGGTDAAVT